MVLKKQIINSIFWSYLQQFANQFVFFFVSIILARLVSPEEVGLIGLITVFISIGSALTEGGLANSIIVNEVNNKNLSFIFFYNLTISILFYILLYILAPYIASFYNKEILVNIIRIYSLTIVFNSFYLVPNTIYLKELKFKKIFFITFPSLILSGIISVLMALNNYGVWSLVSFYLLSGVFNTILFWIHLKWLPSFNIKDESLFKHFKFGMNLMISSLLDVVFRNSYTLIIGKFFKISQVAFYNAANSIVMLPVSNISGAINKVMLPVFSKVKEDDLLLKDIYKKIQLMVIYLILPVVLLIFIFANEIVRILYNEKWLALISILQILSITGLLYPLHYYNILILQVKGRTDLFLYLEIVKKILQLITLFISIKFGFQGLLWGQVIFSILALFINSYFAGKFINYKLYHQIKDLFPILLIGIILLIILYILNSNINFQSELLKLIVFIPIALILYLALSKLLKISSYYELMKMINVSKFLKINEK